MKRKLSVIVTSITVILSISLVAFLGIRGQDTPQTIRVDDISFLDEKGERIERNRVNYKKGVETMEIKYKIYPEDATNKEITLEYFDELENSKVECLASKTEEGIINIDFKGELLEQFYIRIVSVDNANVEASLRYVAKD